MNQQLLATEFEISVSEPVNSAIETGNPAANSRLSSPTVRVGAVSYLNSKPLIEDLPGLLPEAAVSLDYPSRLADQLAAGTLDVALIPSVEYMRGTDYEIISDACVATRGPALRVQLYRGAIRTLALDEGSRTSATLARIMLLERYGVDPARKPLPIEMSVQHTDADAILLIGDRAMHAPQEEFHTVWDLGEEWLTWTGLPFVFAMWVARRGVASAHVEEMLSEARDRGVARISEIARREAAKLNIPVESAERYLTDNLYFRLTSAERSGLRLFQQLSVQAGLAPEGVDLVFRN